MTSPLWFSILFVLFFVSGCDKEKAPPDVSSPEPCSPAWLQDVDRHVQSSDSEGHGPDIGSPEWRSVVEFKLGIREDESVPEVSSADWCKHIDAFLAKGSH